VRSPLSRRALSAARRGLPLATPRPGQYRKDNSAVERQRPYHLFDDPVAFRHYGTSSILRLTGTDTAASPNALITDDHFPAGPPATIM
jgi:hypothetical protein